MPGRLRDPAAHRRAPFPPGPGVAQAWLRVRRAAASRGGPNLCVRPAPPSCARFAAASCPLCQRAQCQPGSRPTPQHADDPCEWNKRAEKYRASISRRQDQQQPQRKKARPVLKNVVAAGEAPELYDALPKALIDEHQPTTASEILLVVRFPSPFGERSGWRSPDAEFGHAGSRISALRTCSGSRAITAR